MKSDKWKQINFDSKAFVLIQHHYIQIPTMYAHLQYKQNTPDHYRVNSDSKYLQHLALKTNIVLSKNSHLSMLCHQHRKNRVWAVTLSKLLNRAGKNIEVPVTLNTSLSSSLNPLTTMGDWEIILLITLTLVGDCNIIYLQYWLSWVTET